MVTDEKCRRIAVKLKETAGAPAGHETFIYTGQSMNPGLKDEDRLLIKKDPQITLSCGDIVVYRGKNRYIIHRFLRRTSNGQIVTKGDNSLRLDAPFGHERLVGKVVAVDRNGERIGLSGKPSRRVAGMIAVISRLEALALGLLSGSLRRGSGLMRRLGAKIKRMFLK